MWDVYVEDGQIFVIDGDATVCEIANSDDYTNPAPDGMKNAHLLAAAPEMKFLLKRLLGYWDDFEETDPAVLDEIIADARILITGVQS